jgi:hypothetical protein
MTIEFNTKTPLTNINELIALYHSYVKDNDEFSEMYDEDANDFMQALSYFRQNDTEALAKHVMVMDTSPRERLIEAFYFDCGNDFVEEVLGYTMSQSWIDFQAQRSA